MKTQAAVLWDTHQDWKIEEVDLDDPGPGEIIVKTRVAGLCHSDEHVVQGDMALSNEQLSVRNAARLPDDRRPRRCG